MADNFTKITEHLYKFCDTCNVYIIKDGDRGILIDAGSGKVLDYLDKIGISHIDWVVHTHHHRDQCWGDDKLIEKGAGIAVPEYERYLFEEVEEFWNHRRIYDNYNDRNTFFSIGKNIPVKAILQDYEAFTWHNYKLEIVPAKGHTMGSIALVAEIDGKKIAFTGDLIYEGGKLYQLHAMEYSYGDMIGLLFTHQSIRKLAFKAPNLCLPSHGPIIEKPGLCIKQLKHRIRRLVRLTCPEKEECLNEHLYSISNHLLWGGALTCSNFYVIKSDSGKALFIDYGHVFGEHMHVGSDREDQEVMRFVAHHLEELFTEYGIKKIDAVIPSHVHDDHTCGIPYLQKHLGVECWTIKQMAPILENPARWSSTPCCYHRPIHIERQFSDGEEFTWEEYKFRIYHVPGQTEFHSVIVTTIDNTKIAFTGDNIFEYPVATWGSHTEADPIQTQVFRNSFQLSMHKKCKEVMNKILPERICPGHGETFYFDKLKAEEYSDYIDQKETLFRELSPEPAEQYSDLFWARLLPYQSVVKSGEEQEFTLLVRNNFGKAKEFRAELLAPKEWKIVKGSGRIRLSSGSSGEIIMTIKAPTNPANGIFRQLVTAEIHIDSIPQGPVAEALVQVKRP